MAASSQAVRASAFTNSIGVQIHMDHTGTGVPYASVSTVEAALAYLNPDGIGTGVGTVRDTTWSPAAALTALGQAGYKLDIYDAYNAGGSNSASDSLNALTPLVNAGYVRLVEGPLEVDNSGWGLVNGGSYTALNGQTYTGWNAAIEFQSDLSATFSGKVPVALFSLAVPSDGAANGPAVQAANGLGISLSSISDLGNVHFYPHNGNGPAVELPGTIASETGYTAGEGFVITETGFNDLNDGSTNYYGTQYSNGVYTLDLVMEAFKAGSSLTDLYELFDENMNYAAQGIAFEDHWGLFNADGTPKAAATDLRNMMTVLGDNGANAATFTPGTLNYTVSGLGSNGDSLLMQKADGTFDIAVWADANIDVNGNPSTAPTQNVTVDLGGTFSQVQVFDPVQGSAAVQTLTNVSSVSLGVTDHPLIIEVSSGTTPSVPVASGGSTTPAPTPTSTPTAPATGSGADTLVVSASEDAWQGDAQFTVSVDGVQVGGVQTVTASHAAGASQDFTFNGNWGTGAHQVGVTFLNDAYAGTPATDRNLYVGGITYDGTALANSGATLWSNGTATASTGTASTGTTAAAPATPAPAASGSALAVGDGQVVATEAGASTTATITGSAEVDANGNDTVNAGDGSDTVKMTDGNVTVNGGTGHLSFVAEGSGNAVLNLAGGSTDAQFGAGSASVNVAGNVSLTGGRGPDTYTFTNDASIDTAVIYGFRPGTDHLQLGGYGNAASAVQWIADSSSGVGINLVDGTHIGLVGVHITDPTQLFA